MAAGFLVYQGALHSPDSPSFMGTSQPDSALFVQSGTLEFLRHRQAHDIAQNRVDRSVKLSPLTCP